MITLQTECMTDTCDNMVSVAAVLTARKLRCDECKYGDQGGQA